MPAPESNVEMGRALWAGFNETGELPLELCDEELEMTNPDRFLIRGPYHGHEGIRQWREDVFDVFDDVRIEVEDVLDAGDGEMIVMFQRLQGTAKHTRIEVDERWAAVCRVRDGKFVEAHGYLSRREALEAAGMR